MRIVELIAARQTGQVRVRVRVRVRADRRATDGAGAEALRAAHAGDL